VERKKAELGQGDDPRNHYPQRETSPETQLQVYSEKSREEQGGGGTAENRTVMERWERQCPEARVGAPLTMNIQKTAQGDNRGHKEKDVEETWRGTIIWPQEIVQSPDRAS